MCIQQNFVQNTVVKQEHLYPHQYQWQHFLWRYFETENLEDAILSLFLFTVNFDLRDNHLSSNVSVIYLYSWRAYLSPLHSICQKYKLPYWSPPLILVDAISRDVTRVTSIFNKLYWGSCFQGVWTAEFTSRELWIVKGIFREPWWDSYTPLINVCKEI